MVSFLLEWPQSKWQRQTMRNQFVSVMSIPFRFFLRMTVDFCWIYFHINVFMEKTIDSHRNEAMNPAFVQFVCSLACLFALTVRFLFTFPLFEMFPQLFLKRIETKCTPLVFLFGFSLHFSSSNFVHIIIHDIQCDLSNLHCIVAVPFRLDSCFIHHHLNVLTNRAHTRITHSLRDSIKIPIYRNRRK